MPKIMFRPNPTPPPFVPPVPSYDTEVHYDFDPFPYELGGTVDLTFKEVNLPDYSKWIITTNENNQIFEPKRHGKIVPNTTVECSTEMFFESGIPYNLCLYDENDNLVYQCFALCDNH